MAEPGIKSRKSWIWAQVLNYHLGSWSQSWVFCCGSLRKQSDRSLLKNECNQHVAVAFWVCQPQPYFGRIGALIPNENNQFTRILAAGFSDIISWKASHSLVSTTCFENKNLNSFEGLFCYFRICHIKSCFIIFSTKELRSISLDCLCLLLLMCPPVSWSMLLRKLLFLSCYCHTREEHRELKMA